MAERVTRQFSEIPSGTPITGGLFRLVNVTDPTDLPHEMVETSDAEFPGRYYTEDGDNLAPGLYRVERNSGSGYEATGEEVSVSPRRVYVGEIAADNPDTTQIDFVVGDTVRAAAFVPEDTPDGSPLLTYLQNAVNYAFSAGLKKVYVGSWRGRDLWEAGSQLNLTAIPGIELDLGGAEIARTESATPIAMAGGRIIGGRIQGTGTASQIIDSTGYVVCRDVTFTGSHAGTTIKNGAGYVGAAFYGCEGHRLWPEDPGVTIRIQMSDTICLDANNEAYYPVNVSHVDPGHLANFFIQAIRESSSAGPVDTTSPFNDGTAMAAALKNYWFDAKPKIDILQSDSDIITRIFVAFAPGDDIRMVPKGYYTDGADWTIWLPFNSAGTPFDYSLTAACVANAEIRHGIVITKYRRPEAVHYHRAEIEVCAAFSGQIYSILYDGRPAPFVPAGMSCGIIRIPASLVDAHLMDVDGTTLLTPIPHGTLAGFIGGASEHKIAPVETSGLLRVLATMDDAGEADLGGIGSFCKSVVHPTYYYLRTGRFGTESMAPGAKVNTYGYEPHRWVPTIWGDATSITALVRVKASWTNPLATTFPGFI